MVKVFSTETLDKKGKRKVFTRRGDDIKKEKKVVKKEVTPKVQEPIKLKAKKEGILSKAKRFLIGDPLTQGREDIRAGTLPIGPGKTIALPKQLAQIGKKINVNALGKTAGLSKQQTKALAVQVGRERINILARYAVNSKSLTLTQKFLKFAKSPTGIVSILGSYPFAGFIKEEALQTLGLGFFQASQNNDIAGMELAIQEQEDILDPNTWEKIISAVPYANVVKQLKDFFKAAIIKLQIDKRNLEIARGEQEGGETQFQEERRESDEQAQLRKLEFALFEDELFALRREGKFEEATVMLKERIEQEKVNAITNQTETETKPEKEAIKL